MLTMDVQNYIIDHLVGCLRLKLLQCFITQNESLDKETSQFTAHHQFNKSDINRLEICC